MAIASKRVLVIGPEYGLVAAIARELEANNTPVTFVDEHAIDWRNSEAVERLFAKQKPHMLLHEIDFYQADVLTPTTKDERAALLKRNQILASICAQRSCVAMFLSDYHVFGAETKNTYDENDPTAPLDSYGAFIAELEQELAATVEKHLILRFSWLIDTEGSNLFTRVLTALYNGEQLPLSRHRRGAPTWRVDARRVITGVLRQVMSGAENWGCFHYGSTDSCNEWEFGQEVAASLAELRAYSGQIVVDQVAKDGASLPFEPASASLNTRRIRNNFGVHGRSWRQGLKGQITQWLDRQAEPEPARSSAN